MKENHRNKTGFVFHEDYLFHHAGVGHPERAIRLRSIIEYLTRIRLIDQLDVITPEHADISWIQTIHAPHYIDQVKISCEQGIPFLDSDTGICKQSFEIARLAVGAGLAAADAIMEKKVKNAFCAVRPPGHHAEYNRARGFCLFNNIAIIARYLQKQYNLNKICIVDWDVHHGNGTQNSFYDDPTVYYFSIHQYPFFPGTGRAEERGDGAGIGYNLNIPLKSGSGDDEFLSALENYLIPEVKKFEPDFILISVGFDAHYNDPLGGLQVTESAFKEAAIIVTDLASQFCDGRIISVLEGGYQLDVLSECTATHLQVLMKGE